jgi:putative transposase
VSLLTRTLEVSRSGFYDWCRRRIPRRTRDDARLIEVMVKLFYQNEEVYGRPRLFRDLRKLGYRIGEQRVRKLMKLAGIRPISEKRFQVRTTDSNHSSPISANLVRRNFKTTRPNQVWVSDITYIRTRRGWAYLCVILDLYSRRIIGWSVRPHMKANLVTESIEMALAQRKVQPWSLTFHSDRGSQYASRKVRSMLRDYKIVSSMSARGDCFDNAVAESVFGTIKTERIYTREYETLSEVKQDLFRYIEGFYNRRRMHSYLGYRSPEEFEMMKKAA